MSKRIFGICAVLLLGSCLSASAQFSANATLTSDYLFRGWSQTDESPALQAGLDYAFNNGFYVGVWGSNVSFGDESDTEVDYFAGYGREFKNGVTLDAGYISYTYLDLDMADEAWLGLDYKNVGVKFWRGFEVEWTYVEAHYDVSLPADFGLSLRAGRWEFDGGGESLDWQVSLSRDFKGFSFEAGYTDTDVDGEPTADARGYLSVSKQWSFKK